MNLYYYKTVCYNIFYSQPLPNLVLAELYAHRYALFWCNTANPHKPEIPATLNLYSLNLYHLHSGAMTMIDPPNFEDLTKRFVEALRREHEGEKFSTRLKERDLISIPPGIYRGLFNPCDEDALMCVMLGTGKPTIPNYPPEHPLSKIKR